MGNNGRCFWKKLLIGGTRFKEHEEWGCYTCDEQEPNLACGHYSLDEPSDVDMDGDKLERPIYRDQIS